MDTMDLCSDRHDEICYTAKKCPLCSALIDLENSQTEVTDLKNELSKAEEAQNAE